MTPGLNYWKFWIYKQLIRFCRYIDYIYIGCNDIIHTKNVHVETRYLSQDEVTNHIGMYPVMSSFFKNLLEKCLDFWSKRNDILVLYREHLPFSCRIFMKIKIGWMRCLLVDGVMDGRGQTCPHIEIIWYDFKLVLLITNQLVINFTGESLQHKITFGLI